MQIEHPHLKARFGALVRTSRNRLGISQEELAGRAGLHRTYVADIERGARNPSLESIEKLAAALEMTMAGLFTPSNEQSESEGVDVLMVEDDPRDIESGAAGFWAQALRHPASRREPSGLVPCGLWFPYASRRGHLGACGIAVSDASPAR